MNRRDALTLLAGITVASVPFDVASAQCDDAISRDHNEWVSKILDRVLSVKPGMTQRQVNVVFEPAGGLSAVLDRTYLSRECPYIAVDVKFKKDGNTIVSISPPYLKLYSPLD